MFLQFAGPFKHCFYNNSLVIITFVAAFLETNVSASVPINTDLKKNPN